MIAEIPRTARAVWIRSPTAIPKARRNADTRTGTGRARKGQEDRRSGDENETKQNSQIGDQSGLINQVAITSG